MSTTLQALDTILDIVCVCVCVCARVCVRAHKHTHACMLTDCSKSLSFLSPGFLILIMGLIAVIIIPAFVFLWGLKLLLDIPSHNAWHTEVRQCWYSNHIVSFSRKK